MSLIPTPHNYMISQAVPFELLDLVCTCDHTHTHTVHSNGISHACSNCGKYYRYVVRRACVDCGDPYVQTFDHPNRCLKKQTCFECLHSTTDLCDHDECQKFRKLKPYCRPEDLVLKQKVKAEDLNFDLNFDFDF